MNVESTEVSVAENGKVSLVKPVVADSPTLSPVGFAPVGCSTFGETDFFFLMGEEEVDLAGEELSECPSLV